MATKIEEFLKDKKIDARRLMAASASIESFTREDRGLRLIKRTARKSEDAAKKKEGLAAKKPRTGRPVTNRAFSAALAGKQIAGAQKTRILRAVNHLLAQKKQEPVELSALFENTARPVKKVEKKAE
ncbi:MAG: hypothetical protein ABJE95_29855 [Byssovorax sp.]